MLKFKLFVFVLVTAFFIPAQAHCQEASPATSNSQNSENSLTANPVTQPVADEPVYTIAGTVTYVDIPGNIIGVETKKGTLVFFITAESELLRYAHRIAGIEISKGDPVVVQYKTSVVGKNSIIKIIDKTVDDI